MSTPPIPAVGTIARVWFNSAGRRCYPQFLPASRWLGRCAAQHGRMHDDFDIKLPVATFVVHGHLATHRDSNVTCRLSG